jgi:CHAD domain-containing protein
MPNSSRAVLDVSRERIWKMYRLVLKEGRAITYDSPPEDMHELRKSCKKLRYLMEFFSSLYPAAKIESQIKVLKVLLNNLGDFQDYEVQAAKLMSVGEQMKKEGKAPTQTVMAMGVLVANLLSRQEQAHKDFSSCFAGFDTPQNHSLNRELFKPATNPEKEEKA